MTTVWNIFYKCDQLYKWYNTLKKTLIYKGNWINYGQRKMNFQYFYKSYQISLLSKSLQAINPGEGVDKREPPYTVGEKAN